MQGWLNIFKSVNVIWHINTKKGENHMFTSLDAEKVCDKNSTLIYDKKKNKPLNKVAISNTLKYGINSTMIYD